MAGEEDAMNVIDKLNQEFDVIMDKNIQLEKENLELYQELHKLKFKIMIEEDDQATWGGELLAGPMRWGRGESCMGIGDVVDWSDELFDTMRGVCPLENNIILKELYGENNWNEMVMVTCDGNGVHPDDLACPPYPVVMYGSDDWATATWSADEWNKKLIDTFPGGVFE